MTSIITVTIRLFGRGSRLQGDSQVVLSSFATAGLSPPPPFSSSPQGFRLNDRWPSTTAVLGNELGKRRLREKEGGKEGGARKVRAEKGGGDRKRKSHFKCPGKLFPCEERARMCIRKYCPATSLPYSRSPLLTGRACYRL